MLQDLSPEEFQYMRSALELAQRMGTENAPGRMSYAALAEWFDTTPEDIKNEEQAALEKIRNILHV